MLIIGLTGAIGSGKTTFGNFLGEQADRHLHLESSWLIMQVANDLRLHNARPIPASDDIAAINRWLAVLPAILEERVHRSVAFGDIALSEHEVKHHPDYYAKLFEYLALLEQDTSIGKEVIDVANKTKHRAILQWLGGYLAKRVAGDIWYRELIERGGGEPGVDILTLGGVRFPADAGAIREYGGIIIGLIRPAQSEQDMKDITERERALIIPDIAVSNDGTIEQLQKVAEQIYKDVQGKQFLKAYRASAVKA